MSDSSSSSSSSVEAKKRKHSHSSHKKRKKEHRHKEHKEHRHKEHRHREHKQHRHKRHQNNAPGAAAAQAAQAAQPIDEDLARSALEAICEAHAGGRAELRALLEMLDSGGGVIFEQIEDVEARARLQAMSRSLGLQVERLDDGSVLHSKPDADGPLAARFASVLEPPARRVYGVAARPDEGIADAAIGPMLPPGLGGGFGGGGGDDDGDGDGDDDDDDDDDVVGPRAAPAGAGSDDTGGGGGGNLWWQQEHQRAKPAAPVTSDADEGPSERDSWMTALPTERSDRNQQGGGEARQFSRTEVKEKGDVSHWTDTPADRARKAKEAEARASAAAAPMSLAEAAAVARSNAGRIPRRNFSTNAVGKSDEAHDQPKPKTLVQIKEEMAAEEKKVKKGKEEWEGAAPWRPFNRETDLDIRKANPKGKDEILKNNPLGSLGDRFGGTRRETTFM